ncbi:MAG: TRAP transporter large permease subunit [Candidatus Omnitrophica bacterium]|nr:TRAP transporter large permease subunit [Candidatus Omnitrophota bacterium]
MNNNILALVIFTAVYISFILFPGKRAYSAVAGAGVIVLLNILSLKEAFFSVNWNVMGIFVGMLAVADVFMLSRVPAYLAEIIANRARNTAWALLFICILTSFISAFVENVATVLIVVPIAISLAKKLKVNPVKMMIAIAISSNLQGAATLIGDPPSMILGGFAKMNFSDFFFYKGRPSIFFAVQLGALASFIVLYFIFRKNKGRVELIPQERVRSWVPSSILVILIFVLAISSFFDSGFSYTAGLLCLVFGAVSLIWQRASYKDPILKGLKGLDWETTFFLAGIFIIIGAVTTTGWVDLFSSFLSGLVGNNIFLGYTTLVIMSVVISAFVDNVPFLAAMLPVAISMSAKLNISPTLFLFGLLIGASLGGNITPIGASANIVACGLLKKEGYRVGFKDFMKIGIPFTFTAVFAAYLFVWFIWGK